MEEDGRKNGRTDGQTDGPCYRDAGSLPKQKVQQSNAERQSHVKRVENNSCVSFSKQ